MPSLHLPVVGLMVLSVDIDNGRLFKFLRLLKQNISANRVFNIHQADNVVFFKTSQKISGCSRIGDNFGSQRIEVSLIVSPRFDVIQAGAASFFSILLFTRNAPFW
jgi:hypothetical protein